MTKEERKEYMKKYYEKKKDYFKKYQEDNKEKLKEYRKEYYNDISVKEKRKEYYKEYCKKDDNIIKNRKRSSDWYKNNKEILNEYYKLYHRNKTYKPLNKCRQIISHLTNKIRDGKIEYDNDVIDYTLYDFKKHIEDLFMNDMDWFNIEIDHIIPLSAFKEDTPIKIPNSLDNLQPLSPIDNAKKYNKIDLNKIHVYLKYFDYLNDEYKYKVLNR